MDPGRDAARGEDAADAARRIVDEVLGRADDHAPHVDAGPAAPPDPPADDPDVGDESDDESGPAWYDPGVWPGGDADPAGRQGTRPGRPAAGPPLPPTPGRAPPDRALFQPAAERGPNAPAGRPADGGARAAHGADRRGSAARRGRPARVRPDDRAEPVGQPTGSRGPRVWTGLRWLLAIVIAAVGFVAALQFGLAALRGSFQGGLELDTPIGEQGTQPATPAPTTAPAPSPG